MKNILLELNETFGERQMLIALSNFYIGIRSNWDRLKHLAMVAMTMLVFRMWGILIVLEEESVAEFFIIKGRVSKGECWRKINGEGS